MKISRHIYTYTNKKNSSGVSYLLRVKNKKQQISKRFNTLYEVKNFAKKNNLKLNIHIPNKLKAYCIERIVSGETIKKVAESLTLSCAMVNYWYKKYYTELNENGFKFILTLESKV